MVTGSVVNLTNDKKDVYLEWVNTLSDAIVFVTKCAHITPENTAEKIIAVARGNQKQNIVLIGGCSDSTTQTEGSIRELVTAAGINLARIDAGGLDEYLVRTHLDPAFKLKISSWQEALSMERLLPHLAAQANRVSDIHRRIEDEVRSLTEFPVVCKVESIEFHLDAHENYDLLGSEFKKLFQIPNEMRSTANAVALINPEKRVGILVTKSQKIHFSTVYPVTQEKLERGFESRHGSYGSLRIKLLGGTAQLSLYLYEGKWDIAPHSELELADPSFHYEPMWQRVKVRK